MTPQLPRTSPVSQRPRPLQSPRAARGVKIAPILPPAPVEDNNPVRRFAYLSGLAMVVLMFGMVAELLAYISGTNTYVLYLVGPFAYLGVMLTGGVGRTLRHSPAKFWMLFFACMVLSTPFSTWKGNSFARVMDYARFSLPLMFVIAGLAVTWNNVRAFFYAIGGAALIVLTASRLFTTSDDGRITLAASGSIGNSNDLASHLVLVLPFLVFIATDPRRKALIRIPLLLATAYGIYVIFGTASRGAMIAFGAMFLVVIWRASMTQRVAAIVLAFLLVGAVPLLLPSTTVSRLSTLFGTDESEADESQRSRSYLFRQSLVFTFEHPLFGVGPDQFGNYEGKTRFLEGEHGEWHATHCAYTQVSSECGIPALVFFLAGIVSALGAVNRTWRRARAGGFTDISRACFCYMVAMVGFLTDVTFLANAYRFYLPAMIGLAIALSSAASRYMDEKLPGRYA
jgi:O-antigen ligase